MPTIHLIDLVLIALVLAYSAIAAWRGGFREGVLGGGLVVTGALIIAPPVDLLRVTAGDQGAFGRVIVALACLGVGLAIGFGASRIVERHASTVRGRLLGGILGFANALWVVTFLLVELQRILGRGGSSGRFADETVLDPLVTHNEVALLALSTFVLLLTGLWTVHLLWTRLGELSAVANRGLPHRGTGAKHRVISIPIGADTGKLEPAGSGTPARLADMVALGRDTALRHRRGDDRGGSWTLGLRESRIADPATGEVEVDTWYSVTRPADSESVSEDHSQ